MDILICQACGSIIRGNSKLCAACGTQITRFSPTSLPATGSQSPLMVAVLPDSLVMEQTLAQRELDQLKETNGGNGYGASSYTPSQAMSPADAGSTIAEMDSTSAAPLARLGDELSAAGEPGIAAASPLKSGSPFLHSLDLHEHEPNYAAQAPNAADDFAQLAPPSFEAAPVGNSLDSSRQALSASPFLQDLSPAQAAAIPPDLASVLANPPISNPTTEPPLPLAGEFPGSAITLPSESPAAFEQFHPTPTPTTSGGLDFFAGQAASPIPALPQAQPPELPTEPSATTPITPAVAASAATFDFFAGSPMASDYASDRDSIYGQSDEFPGHTPQAVSQESAQFPTAAESSFGSAADLAIPVQQAAIAPSPADTPSSLPGFPNPGGQLQKSGGFPTMGATEKSTVAAAFAVDESGFADLSVNRGKARATIVEKEPEKPSIRKAKSKEDEEVPKDSDKSSALAQVLKYLEGDVQIAGKNYSKKLTAIAALLVVFFGFQLLSIVGRIIPGASNSTQDAAPIQGHWMYAFKYKGHDIQGDLYLSQAGNNVEGKGQDGEISQDFQIKGTYQPPKIEFNKQYVDILNQKAVGKPILYSGEVKVDQNHELTMSGIYVSQAKKGVFYNQHIEVVKGWWEARFVPEAAQPNQDLTKMSSKDPHAFQNTMLTFAAGFLIFGLLIALASLKLFGPYGLLIIWEKRKYIPSQFKSQHQKMLGELGKPVKTGGMPLGIRADWSPLAPFEPKDLALTPELREKNPHVLVMGGGHKGKTRYISHLITHDIESRERAVVVIDSDGALTDLIVRWVAAHPKRKSLSQRIIVIDPTHKGGCPSYNPLELPEDGDLQAAASAIVFGFKAIYTEPPGAQSQWNQQTANILRNAALLLIANGKTLVDLPTLLSDNDFRDVLLDKVEKRKHEKVEFITLLETWAQYKRLARTDQWITWVEPILNRISPMLSDPRIRPILTNPKGNLSLRELITEKKILLVKIPQGQLDQNANLLGSLLVTGIKQAALSVGTATSSAHSASLYLDEFDNFIDKETIESLTSETRKFQIGLIVAIKTFQHLPEDFRNQIVINMGTLCAFALAKKDADMLGPQMFRVDGRKLKHQKLSDIFNRVNASPHFELISDEEKLNIDRLVGQEVKDFFCYRVGTVAGVFSLRAYDFPDVPDKDIDWSVLDEMYAIKGQVES